MTESRRSVTAESMVARAIRSRNQQIDWASVEDIQESPHACFALSVFYKLGVAAPFWRLYLNDNMHLQCARQTIEKLVKAAGGWASFPAAMDRYSDQLSPEEKKRLFKEVVTFSKKHCSRFMWRRDPVIVEALAPYIARHDYDTRFTFQLQCDVVSIVLAAESIHVKGDTVRKAIEKKTKPWNNPEESLREFIDEPEVTTRRIQDRLIAIEQRLLNQKHYIHPIFKNRDAVVHLAECIRQGFSWRGVGFLARHMYHFKGIDGIFAARMHEYGVKASVAGSEKRLIGELLQIHDLREEDLNVVRGEVFCIRALHLVKKYNSDSLLKKLPEEVQLIAGLLRNHAGVYEVVQLCNRLRCPVSVDFVKTFIVRE